MKFILALLAFVGIVILTSCSSLGLGGGSDLSGTLSGLDQLVEQTYQQYQAGVAAGQFPPDSRISNYYLQYKFLYGAFNGVLKPKATPPSAVVTAKTELFTAITEAKADAAKAKAVKKTP